MSLLSQKHLQDEKEAYAWVEANLWPNGPECPHCGQIKRISKMEGKATRVGLYKCYACRKQFRVTVKTIFEKSHVPLHLWLQAFYLIAGSKKGISSNQIHRTLGVTLKTAWFMTHRIREAMRVGSLAPPMGGSGQIVEADETYIGRKPGRKKKPGSGHKQIALTLVERGGRARSFQIDRTNAQTIEPIIASNIAHESAVVTDEAHWHVDLHRIFAQHETVNHSAEEYVRGTVYTNTVEGYFSIFKRGMKGVYQHCSEKHLHRYLAEFDFRYSNRVKLGVNDEQRAAKAVQGAVGKRLTYRTTNSGKAS
jgi:transposase-like protein